MVSSTARVMAYKPAAVTFSALIDLNVDAVTERADCVLVACVQEVVNQLAHVLACVL